MGAIMRGFCFISPADKPLPPIQIGPCLYFATTAGRFQHGQCALSAAPGFFGQKDLVVPERYRSVAG